MTLREIAKKIDKSRKNEDDVDISDICENLDIYFYGWIDQDRLKSYWVTNWLCTDTWVGLLMYFLDDEPVGISFQSGRKSDKEFSWFSEECMHKVRDYILSIIPSNDVNCDYTSLDDEVGDTYKISFNNQVIDWGKGLYQGKPFKMIERVKETPDYGIDSEVKIEIDGIQKIVSVEDIDFKYHVLDE